MAQFNNKHQHRYRQIDSEPFDMTPVIDVVFLLIIFFMLVCQFIGAERFAVELPEGIASAAALSDDAQTLTLTVAFQDDDGVLYAVNHERLQVARPDDLSALIAAAIDAHYRHSPRHSRRTVRLRCDKSARFADVRPVLQAIAQSTATDIDWAVRD